MRPTPRVDAILSAPMQSGPDEHSERYRNLIEGARKLEDELEEARKLMINLRAATIVYPHKIDAAQDAIDAFLAREGK
jgi:hypothetical protein